jgi:nucleoside phosphorylase
MALVFVYADDREVDRSRVEEVLGSALRQGRVVLLRTGVGKVRTTMALTRYLSTALASGRGKPTVVNLGTCSSVVPGLLGEVVRPVVAVDRDLATQDRLLEVKIPAPPPIPLAGGDARGLSIASGDSFLTDVGQADVLAAAGVSLVDMETHSVGWVTQQSHAPSPHVIRVVTGEVRPDAIRAWKGALPSVRSLLTQNVLCLSERYLD